jgi:DNA mismatch repair protein MSH3
MRERQSTSRPNQPQISSFFSQNTATKRRASVSSDSPIDLTLDDSDVEMQPPIKKLKSQHPESAASQWRFEVSSRGEHAGTLGAQEDHTRSRVELERILLGTGRQSGCVDEEENSSENDSSSRDGNDSDPAFTELRAMFSLKSTKGSEKLRAKPMIRKTKAAAEVGPGGETYTPYEVQVDCPACSQFFSLTL